MMYGKKRAAAALMAAGALIMTGCAGSTAVFPDTVMVQNAETNVIQVSSREQVKVEPDMAEIVYSVYSQASDAPTCQTQNGSDLDRVLEVLKNSGVEDKSIQTSNYGLNPIYDWNNGRTITGYEMTTQVTVSDIPLEEAGSLIASSVEAGINSIESVTYLCSQYDEAYKEALGLAVEAARVKAETMAEAGGCKLGEIVNIEEYGDSQAARYNSYSAGGSRSMKEAATADMSVMAGQVEIEASITVDFAIE